MSALDPEVIALAEALDDLARFLALHSEESWADWVAKDAALVRRGDGYGVTHFLLASGGIPRDGDLGFHPQDRKAATSAEAEDLNRAFEHLQHKAWRMAEALRHDAEDP